MSFFRGCFIILLYVQNLLAQSSDLWVTLKEVQKIREFWGVETLAKEAKVSQMKVLVISQGFEGLNDSDHRFLPKSAKYFFERTESRFPNPKLGRNVSHLVWAMTGYHEKGPTFLLHDGSTPEGFDRAIEAIHEERPDVVVSTENFEGYGDFDGKGYFNKLVEKAVRDTKTFWIQSAGTYRGRVKNAPVILGPGKHGKERWVQFGKSSSAKLFVRSENTKLQVTLSWNANKQSFRGRGKDLNLFLFASDSNGEISKDPIASSTLIQVTEREESPQKTIFPIEQIFVKSLAASEKPYHIVVKYASGEFLEDTDSLRLTVTSNKAPYEVNGGDLYFPVELESADPDNQVMVPADNPWVITVGDLSPYSSVGNTASQDTKPDLILDWVRLPFSDSLSPVAGNPDTIAGVFGGIVTLLKARAPNLSLVSVKKWIKKMHEERGANHHCSSYDAFKKTDWQLSREQIKEAKMDRFLTFTAAPPEFSSLIRGVKFNGFGVDFGLRKPFADIPVLKNLDTDVLLRPWKYEVYLIAEQYGSGPVNLILFSKLKGDYQNLEPWYRDPSRHLYYKSIVRLVPLDFAMSPRDMTQGKSLRWRTPTENEIEN